VIDEHLDAFLETARRHADGASVPAFVELEFRDFLTSGVLAHGFARLRCTDCPLERLVPFSCKGRGFCPSCGGRRMTECAARLVDEVLPRVPVRQWVLGLPYRLRYLLAWDHSLARAVLGVYVRVFLGFQRHRARRYGIRDGRSGSVTVIQRFGGGLNLNVHYHTLLFDGVFFIERGTHTSRASIYTPTSMCRREIVCAWNNSVAICFGQRWRRIGSGCSMMGVWRSR
jgi:Transposase zinc-binding domain/Putative transposase